MEIHAGLFCSLRIITNQIFVLGNFGASAKSFGFKVQKIKYLISEDLSFGK